MKKVAKNIHTKPTSKMPPLPLWRKSALIATIIIFLYVALIKRVFITPDILFIFLCLGSVLAAKGKEFFIRFVPIFSLLALYELFRGLAHWLNNSVHYTPMITFDRWLTGGTLPTVWLQDHLWNGAVRWYDFYFYALYMLHFVAPLGFAVFLWRTKSQYYWKFVLGLITLSFAGFVTYLAYPAAPPWMSKEIGIIPENMTRISSHIWYAMGVESFSEVYGRLPANPVAAVPSLHSAYPLLIALFIIASYGLKKTWWVLFYPISMWIGVVYIGEHYVIDALLGALYAYVAFWFATNKKVYHFIKNALQAALKKVLALL